MLRENMLCTALAEKLEAISCLLDSRHLLRLLLHLGRLHLGGVRLLPNLKQVQHAWTSQHLQALNKMQCTLSCYPERLWAMLRRNTFRTHTICVLKSRWKNFDCVNDLISLLRSIYSCTFTHKLTAQVFIKYKFLKGDCAGKNDVGDLNLYGYGM